MTKAEIDRLGERLRVRETAEDLALLGAYREGFNTSFEAAVERVRSALGVEVSGRPAKSTPAILAKLRRGSTRLSQIQDIAGCRIIVSGVVEQNQVCSEIQSLFDVSLFDRREKPSYGYRAVHLVVRNLAFPVEIQVRTSLQHLWAALSEKMADHFDIALKYGGGPEELRSELNGLSDDLAKIEKLIEQGEAKAQAEQVLGASYDKISGLSRRLLPKP